jgi:hypothetical protein
MRPSIASRSAWVFAFGVLAACGGGGAPPATVATTQVQGKVTSRNGLAFSLGGVVVSCPESGGAATTGPDGSFRVDVPAGLPFQVDFDDPRSLGVLDRFDCEPSSDPDPDADDLRRDGVAIGALGEGETCDLEVALVDGAVVAYRLARDGDGREGGLWEGETPPANGGHEPGDAPDRCGEGWLFPTLPEHPLLGQVEVSRDGDCWVVEVEVDCGFETTGTFTVEVVLADGTTRTLGTVGVTSDGGHTRFTLCPADGADLDPEALAGAVIQVLDAEGNVVLTGVIPDLRNGDGWEFPHGDRPPGGDGGTWPDGPNGVPGLPDDFPDWDDLRDLLDDAGGAPPWPGLPDGWEDGLGNLPFGG